jgi:single-strand DNA-binding protein
LDKDNQKRYATEIVATEMKLLGRRMDANPAQEVNAYSAQPIQPVATPVYQQPAPQPAPAPVVPADSADDLPF